jgi:hypothetical protein
MKEILLINTFMANMKTRTLNQAFQRIQSLSRLVR